MRLHVSRQPIHLQQRPFAGGRGASLYLGDADPASDPGARCIVYRRFRIFSGGTQIVLLGSEVALGGSSVPKTPAVAQVNSSDSSLEYPIPAELAGRVVWAQVRTFEGDVENETIYRPRRIVLDGAGELDERILGTATVTEILALDGGGVLVRFSYTAASDGTQPTAFALVRTAGPTSPSAGTVDAVTGQRRYEISIPSLQDGGNYTFTLRATAGAVTADLATGLAFTADGNGPPAVTGLAATEY